MKISAENLNMIYKAGKKSGKKALRMFHCK